MNMTYWRQLTGHGVLHLFEFFIAFVYIAFMGELVTLFQYSTFVLPLSAMAGALFVLGFVYREFRCKQEASFLMRNTPSSLAKRSRKPLVVDGKRYGSYNPLEIQLAKLSVLADSPFYFLKLFTHSFRTQVGIFLRLITVFSLTMVCMAVFTWHMDPALLQHDVAEFVLHGNPAGVDILFARWSVVGLGVGFILGVIFQLFFHKERSILDTLVAQRLQSDRIQHRQYMVQSELWHINARYPRDTLTPDDLARMDPDDSRMDWTQQPF